MKTAYSISSRHPGGANSVFCDGHTSFLQDSLPMATLEAIATPAGGEVVGDYEP